MPSDIGFVFEDSLGGIEAGKAAGMRVVGLATTNRIDALTDARVDLAVQSFEEITLERMRRLFS